MRIHTKLVFQWDGDSYVLVDENGYEYPDNAPIASCKGDDTAKQSEELSQQNQQSQMDFSKSLMDIFQKQYANNTEVLNYIKGKMQPLIDNPTGYSQDALNAMRTSATDTLSNQYQNAQKTLNSNQFAQGSRDLPSGVSAQLSGSLMASEAADKAGAENNITLQNENMKQQNYWNAMNTLNGVAAAYNPLGYSGAATGAANSASNAADSAANLSNAYTNSNQSQLMGALGGIAGGVLGGAAGNPKGFSSLFGCWIAAAHFNGWDDVRTKMVRQYLWTSFIKNNWYGAPVMRLYRKYGERAAKNRFMVWTLGPLFDMALAKAQR